MTRPSPGARRNALRALRPAALLAAALVALLAGGCSRQFWRHQADRDVYNLLVEKQNDPRWELPRLNVIPDPRSRFYDPYDLDKGPLPPDDPAAGQYMLCVAGKRGYKSWHKFGRAFSIENPQWLKDYGLTKEMIEQAGANGEPSSVAKPAQLDDVTLRQAVELAYIHNRDYQTEIENVYLRSLELTFERFQFGVRYLGFGAREPTVNAEHRSTPHGPNNVGLDSRFGVSQLLPSGGQVIVEMANNTLWMFSGPDGINTASALSYSIVQPLLFQAGRKIALENLTQSERSVLYEVRNLARFRKVLFASIVGGNSGFLSVLQDAQFAQNRLDNVRRTLGQLEALRGKGSQVIPTYYEDLERLPAGITFPPTVATRLRYDPVKKRLSWHGLMYPYQAAALRGMSNDPAWQAAVASLVQQRIFEPLAKLPAGVTIPESLRGQLTYSPEKGGRLYWKGDMTESQELLLLSLSDDDDWQQAAGGLVKRMRLQVSNLNVLQLQSRLLSSQNAATAALQSYRNTQDRFKLLLGLPPNIGLTTDLGRLKQFQLTDPRILEMEKKLEAFVDEWAKLDESEPDETQIRSVLKGLRALHDEVQREVLGVLRNDLESVRKRLPKRLKRLPSAEDRGRLQSDFAKDEEILRGLESEFEEITRVLKLLEHDFGGEPAQQRREREAPLAAGLGAAGSAIPKAMLLRAARPALQKLREELLRLSRSSEAVQNSLRVELIDLAEFSLSIDEVVRLALQNRLDLKNARAQVMDARRKVEIAANRLQALLNLRVEGDINTKPGTRPLDFRGRQSNFRVGIGFTAPLDLVNERNAYRDAQIAYQRARRSYMALEDSIKLSVRDSWRNLTTLEQNFERARRNMRASAVQFDVAATLALSPDPRDQARDQGLNLLSALNSVLSAQDSLIRTWVDYEGSRLNIYRDMGIMKIDPDGLWDDPYYKPRATEGPGSIVPPPAPSDPTRAPADEPRPAPQQSDPGISTIRPLGGESRPGVARIATAIHTAPRRPLRHDQQTDRGAAGRRAAGRRILRFPHRPDVAVRRNGGTPGAGD